MEPLPVDSFQLQRRDPAAWSALLARAPETDDVIVTAVATEPLCSATLAPPGRAVTECDYRLRRYILTLDGHSDPISFIAKQTNAAEALFYHLFGDPPGTAVPACRYAHLDGDASWVVIDDVPDHFPSAVWTAEQVDRVVETLARVHAARWNREAVELNGDWGASDHAIPHFLRRAEGPYSWDELRRRESVMLEEVPAAVLSRHAVHNAGRLAPLFLRAANGLVVMRDLGGWPGVLGESHLAAAADLLDDPVPMLAPLIDLPATLLHGSPHPGHWRLTLFDEQYLIDWSEVQIGPGVLDLMAFLEGFPLLLDSPRHLVEPKPHLRLREVSPLAEETIVDTYLLTLSAELGERSPARAFRAALPAARCLHVLLTWFPFFASWASDMPDRYTWQRVNRMEEEAMAQHYHNVPAAGLRRYLAGVFERFLDAAHSL